MTNIPIKTGKYPLENYLEIHCVESFKKDQVIEIVSNDNIICGWLIIKANDISIYKYIPIIIVPVKIHNVKVSTGNIVSGGEDFFKQGLKQAYVFPKHNVIEKLSTPLDLTRDGTLLGLRDNYFKRTYCDTNGIAENKINSSRLPLLTYLDQQLDVQFQGKYSRYYKLYFIDESYPVSINGRSGFIIQGFSNFKTLHGVYFRGHDKSTVTHETLHALGLPHTFDGVSKEALFSYKAQETDNLMDYCHWNVDIQGNPRKPVQGKTLFYWQMSVLNPKLKTTSI